MPTPQQLSLICNNDTVAHFKSWGQAIGDWFSSCGWSKTGDTGQVDWSTIAAVPGAGAYVYEIWQPGDTATRTPFYVKVEYGNLTGSANNPTIRIGLGTGTDGAGVLTGISFTQNTNANVYTAPSTTATYDCRFSGGNNWIAVMMWRDAPSNAPHFFAIERSMDGSGAYTSDYVTVWTVGYTATNSNSAGQRSLIFGVGAAPATGPGITAPNGWVARLSGHAGASSAANNAIPFDACSPLVGRFGQPCTVCGVTSAPDTVEAVTFPVSLYGATRTYLPSSRGVFGSVITGFGMLCMRYD